MGRVNRREFLKLGALGLVGAMSLRKKASSSGSSRLYLPFLSSFNGGETVAPTDTSLVDRIQSWQAQAIMIHSGGVFASSFANNASLAAGSTYISGIVSERILQDGYIRHIKVGISTTGDGTEQIKFKVFRPNGATYNYISQSEPVAVTAIGTQTFTLAQPMACQPGDILGVYIPAAAEPVNVSAASSSDSNTVLYDAGDITSTDPFSSALSNCSMCIEGLTNRPYLCVTGDSIAAGYGTASPWNPFYNGGPAGNLQHEIWHQLRGLIGTGGTLQYQNYAMNGEVFGWVYSTGLVSALAANPAAVLIHCGSNDVYYGISWSETLGYLNSIRALVPSTVELFIDEIWPSVTFSDVQASTVRTWNASYASWCAANDATLVRCYDAIGVNRGSTAYVDSQAAALEVLAPAYDSGDGVHPSDAGVNEMAALVLPYL